MDPNAFLGAQPKIHVLVVSLLTKDDAKSRQRMLCTAMGRVCSQGMLPLASLLLPSLNKKISLQSLKAEGTLPFFTK